MTTTLKELGIIYGQLQSTFPSKAPANIIYYYPRCVQIFNSEPESFWCSSLVQKYSISFVRIFIFRQVIDSRVNTAKKKKNFSTMTLIEILSLSYLAKTLAVKFLLSTTRKEFQFQLSYLAYSFQHTNKIFLLVRKLFLPVEIFYKGLETTWITAKSVSNFSR